MVLSYKHKVRVSVCTISISLEFS